MQLQVMHTLASKDLPGKPVAKNYGLLSINYGLLWGISVLWGCLAFHVVCGYIQELASDTLALGPPG